MTISLEEAETFITEQLGELPDGVDGNHYRNGQGDTVFVLAVTNGDFAVSFVGPAEAFEAWYRFSIELLEAHT